MCPYWKQFTLSVGVSSLARLSCLQVAWDSFPECTSPIHSRSLSACCVLDTVLSAVNTTEIFTLAELASDLDLEDTAEGGTVLLRSAVVPLLGERSSELVTGSRCGAAALDLD